MTEQLIATGTKFHIFENDHGFRIIRLEDGEQCTFYGDDNCEDFRNRFHGDEYADDPAENQTEADEFGAWCVRESEMGPLKHEFAFDVILTAAIRVKATTEAEAIKLLVGTLDSADANLGAWPDGRPVLCEVSYEPGSAKLYEIDGEEI